MSDFTVNAEAAATAKGLVVVRPKPNELFIDIDDAESLKVFHRSLAVMGSIVLGHTRTPSPSGKADRWHIRVTIAHDVADDRERIALQALLGSDRLHEVLCWKATMNGTKGVTLFFEKPTGIKEMVVELTESEAVW